MKKIKATLQKMKYSDRLWNKSYEYVCLVDDTRYEGEYTFCGNAIPNSDLDIEGFEAIGDKYEGSIKEVTCPYCLKRIEYIKSLK
jgi:hypothetical protein